jgi:hypothetical protein
MAAVLNPGTRKLAFGVSVTHIESFFLTDSGLPKPSVFAGFSPAYRSI